VQAWGLFIVLGVVLVAISCSATCLSHAHPGDFVAARGGTTQRLLVEDEDGYGYMLYDPAEQLLVVRDPATTRGKRSPFGVSVNAGFTADMDPT
jgi:hypothetical protein